MLVLTRKLGESIVISDDVVVRLTAIHGNRVKIAIEAPRSRRILRGEIAAQQGAKPGTEPLATRFVAAGPDAATPVEASRALAHAQ